MFPEGARSYTLDWQAGPTSSKVHQGGSEPRDLGVSRIDLHSRGAARDVQVRQAGFGCDGSVDEEGVVDQDALSTALDGEPGRCRIAAHQRGLDPQVAHHLQIGGDAAAAVESSRGGRAAHEELGEICGRCVQGAGRCDGDIPVQAYAAVREGGQQSPVLLAKRYQGVLDLQVSRCTPQLGGVHEGRGREAVDREVRGWGDASAVLQGRDAGVDVIDRGPQTVEICDQGVPRVRLTLRPAVAGDLESAAVAQDGLGGEGGLTQQVSDHLRGELRLDEVVDSAALGSGGGKYRASRGPRLVLRKRLSASALDQESLRMRRVDWLPRMASPVRGASDSNSKLRIILGVNCS